MRQIIVLALLLAFLVCAAITEVGAAGRLVITTPVIDTPIAGVPYSFQMRAEGCNPATYVWSGFGLPVGLTISTRGLISGTPKQAGPSSYTITVRAKGC